MEEVDPAFIQEPDHRPKLSPIEAEDIPIIDLSPIINKTVEDPSAIEVLVKEIGSACKEWGFFQVINHGVPLTLSQKIEEASRKFFAQNLEDKRKVSRNETSANGYYDTEHTKNVRDWKEVFDFLVKEPTFLPATHEHDDKVWSNDAYESVEHRVMINSEEKRFSIPFFFYPADDSEIKPLEELINEQNPAKYRPYKWGKFIVNR